MDKRILKAYERYDYNGRVVPGSLVLRYKKPKNGKWKELTGYECCNDTTTTTTTAAPNLRMSVSTLLPDSSFSFYIAANASGPMNFSINYGDGNPLSPINISAGSNTVVTHTFLAPNDYQIELIFTDGSNENINTFEISYTSLLTGITNLSAFSNARILNFSNTNIDVLEIPVMPNLYNLFLSNCSNLSISLFESLPVGSLPSLITVYCDNTAVSNINILAAPELYLLYSQNAQIGDPANIDNIFINMLGNNIFSGEIIIDGGTNAAPTATSAAARSILAAPPYNYVLVYN